MSTPQPPNDGPPPSDGAPQGPYVPVSPLLPDDPPKVGDFWLDARLNATPSGVAYTAHDDNNNRPAMLIFLSEGAAEDAAARDRLAGVVNAMHIDTVLARGGHGQAEGRLGRKFRAEDDDPVSPDGRHAAPWVALAYDGSPAAAAEAERVLAEVQLSTLPPQGEPSGPDYRLYWIHRIRPGLARLWPLPWPGRFDRAGWKTILVSWLLMLLVGSLAVLIAILIFRNQPPENPPPPTPPKGECSVGDYAWVDLNDNGLQDDEEPAVEGVPVVLLIDGEQAGQATTNAAGKYTFNKIECREYQIGFQIAQNFDFAQAKVGDDDEIDSDPEPTAEDPRVGITARFTLGGDNPDSNMNLDAGLVPNGSPPPTPPPSASPPPSGSPPPSSGSPPPSGSPSPESGSPSPESGEPSPESGSPSGDPSPSNTPSMSGSPSGSPSPSGTESGGGSPNPSESGSPAGGSSPRSKL